MARYMRPENVLIPPEGGSDVHYFIRLFEATTIDAVQTLANIYLTSLEAPDLPQFALIESTHLPYISAPPMPENRYVIKLTLMWIGGPIAFVPPL